MQANGPDDYPAGGPPPAQSATPAPPGYPPQPQAPPMYPQVPPGYPQAPPMYQQPQPRHMPESGYDILAKVRWGTVILSIILVVAAAGLYLLAPDIENEDDFWDLMKGVCLVLLIISIAAIVILIFTIIGLIKVHQTAQFIGGEVAERTKIGIILIIVSVVLSFLPFISAISGVVGAIGWYMILLPLMRDEYKPWAISFLVGSIVAAVAGIFFSVGSYAIKSEEDFILLLQGIMAIYGLSIILNALYAVLIAKAGEQAAALWQDKGLSMMPPAPVMPYGGAPPMYPPQQPQYPPPTPPQY